VTGNDYADKLAKAIERSGQSPKLIEARPVAPEPEQVELEQVPSEAQPAGRRRA
jgi:hypothetical protein